MARARLPRSARPSGVPRSISASTGHAAADATDPPAFIREANGTEGQQLGPGTDCRAPLVERRHVCAMRIVVETMTKKNITVAEVDALSARTIAHYDRSAQSFWEGTRDHDVSQNTAAFLGAIAASPPLKLLDFGCGPGRDLAYFRSLGHEATGLDGSARFVRMARAHAGCEVLHQDFLHLALSRAHYDGVYANASLFHVPSQELPRVLGDLHTALKEGGVLFCSNPHGRDSEGFTAGRYGAFHTLETWRAFMTAARFVEIAHYFRPEGKPRSEQPWLATLWRKAT